MRATHWSVVGFALLGACAVQEDGPAAVCGIGNANCNVAGSNAMAGAAGAVPGGAGAGGSGNGVAGTGQAGSGQAGAAQAGSGQGGTAQAGSGQAGTAQAGAAQAGSGQGGTAQAGSGQAGAAQAGAPQAGSGAAGAPATGTVVIETNRDKAGVRYYLKVAPNNYLQWVATTVADAEKFEQISVGTDLVKLRATSVNKYVALDQTVATGQTAQNDYLIANADLAGAAVLNIALCAATNAAAAACAPNCRGIQVTNDDDDAKYVASDDQFPIVSSGARARSASCGAGSTAWESWQFIAQ